MNTEVGLHLQHEVVLRIAFLILHHKPEIVKPGQTRIPLFLRQHNCNRISLRRSICDNQGPCLFLVILHEKSWTMTSRSSLPTAPYCLCSPTVGQVYQNECDFCYLVYNIRNPSRSYDLRYRSQQSLHQPNGHTSPIEHDSTWVNTHWWAEVVHPEVT